MKSGTSANQILQALGIDTSSPGFYDDPRFIAAERKDPAFLETYARFIREQHFGDDYLQRAGRIISTAVKFLFDALDAEDQRGKCIDGSMVLMRFLERQGVWSYAAKGALTVFFAKDTRLPTTYMAPIMHSGNNAKAGHVWLYAPPFVVADAATRLQPYTRGQQKHVPSFVLAKELQPCRIDAHDLIEPEACELFFFQNRRPPSLLDAERMVPGLLNKIKQLGSGEVRHEVTTLRYIATGVSAPVESLEDWRNIQVRGKYPIELYDDFVAELNRDESLEPGRSVP